MARLLRKSGRHKLSSCRRIRDFSESFASRPRTCVRG